MACMSAYLQQQVLDWIKGGLENGAPEIVIDHSPEVFMVADNPLTIPITAHEIAVLGAAAILTKNPEVTRRFLP